MNINSIRLINFRNYENLALDLNKNINVFIGKNAQGKTNFLEAIYMVITGRSFRTRTDKETINFDKNQAYIGLYATIDRYEKLLELKLDRNQPKIMRINKNVLRDKRDLISGLNVVVFSPDDLDLVKEGPSRRRDFLDREISQINPLYDYNLSRYNKVLYQRNNLLKFEDNLGEKKDLLEVFNIQLVELGSKIIYERVRYVKNLSDFSRLIHRDITSGLEDLGLKYYSSVSDYKDLEDIRQEYSLKLRSSLDKDIKTRTTGLGPHRDDIVINSNGKDLRVYGSQGQQRTAVLSIKLGELEIIKMEKGHYPILLLDDVFSELDRDRRRFLIESFKDIQTFITVTDVLNLEEMKDINKSIYYVENGLLKGEENL